MLLRTDGSHTIQVNREWLDKIKQYDLIISTNYIDTFMNTFEFWQSHYLLSLYTVYITKIYIYIRVKKIVTISKLLLY